MPDRYSQINLAEIEDVAPANGFADRWQARVARTPLGAQLDGEERARAVGVVPRSSARIAVASGSLRTSRPIADVSR